MRKQIKLAKYMTTKIEILSSEKLKTNASKALPFRFQVLVGGHTYSSIGLCRR